MNKDQSDASAETISVRDMQMLLQDEIREVTKAAELRIREFADLATAYAAGQLTPQQATDRYIRYQDKWGEALPVVNVKGMTDEEIHVALDRVAGPHMKRAENRKRYGELFPKGPRTPE
jgi:hypothetical protein